MTGMANAIDEAFVARLRILIAQAGSASALVKRAGISTSGFHKYLSGAEPTRRVLISLAQAGGVHLEWLLTGSGPMNTGPRDSWPENHLTLLPLYCDCAPDADPADDAQTDKLVQLAFCREWLAKYGFDPAHLATIRVSGDSMAPTFRHGDTLVVDCRRTTVTDGEIYVVRDNGALFIRRLQRGLGGRVTLLSDNMRYPALETEIERLNVLGNVIWRGALL
ncbi:MULTISPECIES: LexA family transcriptional regulator [Paraburkholderia]|uniref:LexA family transcriptional regulator n=1 Tax=Paraburkholderia TaxID=1822464 RepID=UPI002AB08482|nr:MULTISPECIES: S24 family peptidase [Paraburkholderia]